jgi:pimeloyl-ACP methyl ester carboxylesterase
MPVVQDRFCDAAGVRIHYIERQSRDDSNTLVLLHSFASGAFLWRKWVASLKFYGRILAPDLPGNGGSILPLEKPSLGYHVRFLNQFCEEVQIEKFIGLGVSMGSNILAAFSLDSPGKVERLILTSPIDETAPMNSLWKIAAQPGIGELITKVFPLSKSALQKQISKNFFNPELLNSDVISEWWNSFQTGVVRRWIPMALRVPQSPIQWQDISVPSTVVFGKNDPVVTRNFKMRLQSAIPRAAFVELDDCGHYPHIECPEKIEDLLVRLG